MGMDINLEILYKAMLLHGRIDEIPAHLDWSLQNAEKGKRASSMRLYPHLVSVLVSGFIFRPLLLFGLPGLGLLIFAAYVNAWMLIHFWEEYQRLSQYSWFLDRASEAVEAAYIKFPHTFVVGMMSLVLAIQLLSLGILARQNKKYFEEMFHLCTTLYRSMQRNGSRQ
jgi:hypothetical protein